MKKYLSLALAVIVALIPVIRLTHVLYPETAIIVDMDYKTDTVTVADCCGTARELHGCEDYSIGDMVRMLMYDNGTPQNNRDDQIIFAWYAGTLDMFAQQLAIYGY